MKRGTLWSVALLGSALLLTLVFSLTDLSQFRAVLGAVTLKPMLLGLVVLQLEGLCTALRLSLLAPIRPPLSDCMLVTGWWVASLALLPARLGELVGLDLLHRKLSWTPGGAFNSLLVQRLFDILLLALLGSAALLLNTRGHLDSVSILALAGAVTALGLVYNLPVFFSLIAKSLASYRAQRFARLLLGHVLSARRAAKDVSRSVSFASLGFITTLKWCCNLFGLALVVTATLPALPFVAAVIVSTLSNFAAIVPIQTVGGIGLGETVFTGGFSWFGVSTETAAAAALVMRGALIIAPLTFWLLVIINSWIWKWSSASRAE